MFYCVNILTNEYRDVNNSDFNGYRASYDNSIVDLTAHTNDGKKNLKLPYISMRIRQSNEYRTLKN